MRKHCTYGNIDIRTVCLGKWLDTIHAQLTVFVTTYNLQYVQLRQVNAVALPLELNSSWLDQRAAFACGDFQASQASRQYRKKTAEDTQIPS